MYFTANLGTAKLFTTIRYAFVSNGIINVIEGVLYISFSNSKPENVVSLNVDDRFSSGTNVLFGRGKSDNRSTVSFEFKAWSFVANNFGDGD